MPVIKNLNAITIDVEDWFHVCGLEVEEQVHPSRHRVLRNVESILSLLAEFNVHSTFFVLGSVAEREPLLVPMIAAAGHEIASHGYSHELVPRLGPQRFRDEVRRTGELLERQSGMRPIGFRAPQWSLGESLPWAFDILHEEGYLYDSSLNPLPLVGNGSGSRVPFKREAAGGTLLEIPPMVTPSLLGNLPSGGGWGFRFFPLRMISKTIQRLNGKGFPAVLYLHPREMEAEGPRLKLSPVMAFAAYGPRKGAGGRLRLLLESFRFDTMRHLVEQWGSV